MSGGFGEDGEIPFDDGLSFEAEVNGELSSKDLAASGGGKSVDEEGRYHVIVTAVKGEPSKPKDSETVERELKDIENAKSQEAREAAEKRHAIPVTTPSVAITFQVLAGDHPDQIGRYIYHRLWPYKWSPEAGRFVPRKGKDLKFILQIATGLRMCEQSDAESGQPIPLHFKNADGMQAVVEVRKEEDKFAKKDADGKAKYRYIIPFGNVWRPTDEIVVDVPKDPELMAVYVSTFGPGTGDAAAGTGTGGGGGVNLFG